MKKLFIEGNKVVVSTEDIEWIMFLTIEGIRDKLNVNLNWYLISISISPPIYFSDRQKINKLISK